MADGNLSNRVTADITDLVAKMAIARQVVAETTAVMKARAQELRDGGASDQEAAAAIGKEAAAAAAAQAQLRGLTGAYREATGAGHAFAANTAVLREALVMTHETLLGNYKRLVGSTMVMAEHTGGLGAAFSALAGPMGVATLGAAAVAAALVVMGVRAVEAERALRGVTNAAALMGRDTAEAAAGAARVSQGLEQVGMRTSDISAVNVAVARMTGTTQALREQFAALAPALRAAFPEESVDKYFGALIEAADGGAAGVRKYLAAVDGLNDANIRGLATAEAEDDRSAAQAILLTTMTDRLAGYNAEFKRHQAILDDLNSHSTGDFAPLNISQFPVLSLPQSPLPQAQAENPQQVQDTETTVRYSQELTRQIALTHDLEAAKRSLTTTQGAGDQAGIAVAEAAIQKIQTDLSQLKAPGDADWASKIALAAKEAGDAAEVAAHNSSQSRQQIMEAGTKAEMAIYRQAAQDMTRTDAERTAMRRQAIDLEMSLVRQEAGAATAAAKQGYDAKVAAFDQEIAAAKGNAAQIIALEAQKLAYIKSVHGEASAQYQEALKSDTEAVSAAVAQQVRAIEEAGKRSLASQRQVAADELATHQITKQQEAEQVLQEAETERDSELQQLNTLLDVLQTGTAAYTAAIAARTKLIQDFGVTIGALQAKQDAVVTAGAQKMAQSYLSAFDQIGSAAERAFVGLATYSTTWQKAEQQILQSVVSSFASMTMTMVSRWAASEVEKVVLGGETSALLTAQNNGLASGWTTVMQQIWTHYFGTQAQIVALGATVQTKNTTEVAAAQAAQTASVTAAQTAQTAAVVAGGVAQVAATTTAAAAGAAAQKTAGLGAILHDAYVAAAGAYASAAQIPYVGWILGPIAGAAAFAAVAAFGSFAVGSGNIPQDMLAQVHAGEMIVPASFASDVRSGVMSIGGPGGAGGAGGAGGNTINQSSVTFNVSTLDAASFQAYLNKNGRIIAAQVAAQFNTNPGLRPSY